MLWTNNDFFILVVILTVKFARFFYQVVSLENIKLAKLCVDSALRTFNFYTITYRQNPCELCGYFFHILFLNFQKNIQRSILLKNSSLDIIQERIYIEDFMNLRNSINLSLICLCACKTIRVERLRTQYMCFDGWFLLFSQMLNQLEQFCHRRHE